jgi:thiol-disulfide isomerase/thioredoxin
MQFPASVLAILIIVGFARADDSEQSWQIHGQVVDEHGAPVEDFEAATFWLSNGNWWDDAGELVQEAKEGKLWKNEGVLAASPKQIAKRLPGGRFSLTIDGRSRVSIFAVDKRRERGGIVLMEQSAAEKPITITMEPLVRVTARVHCSEAGRTPEWSNAIIFVPDNKGNRSKLTICGSFRGQVSFLLPPGTYDLDAYSSSPSATLRIPEQETKDAAATPRALFLRVEIPRGQTTLDLGVLDLKLPRDKDGVPRDLTQYYGKVPPELEITDARGVPRTVKLADFRGKWVLLEFWTVSCGPCVNRNLPELAKFYEEHAADRDRFEILAICNTEADDARTIEAYDALAAPLIKEAWAGKELPFPVLIDGEGRSFGVYGIQGVPNVLLIDPEGRLVKDGDAAMLAEKFKKKKR